MSLIILCLLCFATISKIPGNLFIVDLNIKRWKKKQVLNSCDFVVSCIAVLNVLMLCISVGFSYGIIIIPNFYLNDKFTNSLMFLCLFVLFSSVWFSAWLCAVYCLRTINSDSKLFLWLKTRFPKFGPLLVCASVVASLIINLPGLFDLQIIAQGNITENVIFIVFIQTRSHCFFFVFISLTSLAFVIILSSVMATLTSLFKHIRRMKENKINGDNYRLTAHFGAAKTVTFLLLLYLSLYIFQFLIFSKMASPGQPCFCSFMVTSFPTINSIVIIQGNPRLRTTFFSLLQSTRCGNELN